MTEIIGITRVRDESLILADTLEHFFRYCSHIVLYDDCSTDHSAGIAQEVGGDRILVIRGDDWRTNRNAEETRHRALACRTAVTVYDADWILCFDADERLVGDLPDLTADGYTFRLFDGYLTEDLQADYDGGDLADLPRLYGPEYRDILMLFRPEFARWNIPGLREPQFSGRVELAPVFVKHFGKCLSVEQWNANCRYYMTGFGRSFRDRWQARLGKAIHTRSDFDRSLLTWDELMKRTDTWTAI